MVSKKNIHEKLVALLLVAIVILILVIFYTVLGTIQYYFLSLFPGPFQLMEHLYIPLLPKKIGLDIIGFCIPLVVSVLMVRKVYKSRHHQSGQQSYHSLIVLLLGIVIATALPLFVPSLQTVNLNPNKGATGAGDDWAVVLIISIYAGYLISRWPIQIDWHLYYPLGFLIGVCSDISALPRLYGHGFSIFGIRGVVDGDFLAPLVLLLAALVSEKIVQYFGQKAQKRYPFNRDIK